MYLFPKYTFYLAVGMVVISAIFLVVMEKNTLLTRFRPFIADHIIAIQDFRKLSNIIFLPQILFEKEAESLPTYELTITKRDLARLKEHLPQGDYTEIEAAGKLFNAISDDNKFFVPGIFMYQGKSYDVSVRLRGTSYDHWYFPKKSWNIKFKKKSPLGIQEIGLIIPRDRGYLTEELNHHRGRKLGLLVPQSGFANLSIDGKSEGVYWWVEDWSEDMLLSHGKEGCLFGAELSLEPNTTRDPAFDKPKLWKDYTNCGSDGKAKLKMLLSLLTLSKNEFPKAAEKILDIRKVLTWDVVSRLAGSDHARGYNMRVFWDKTTDRFEFIPWDIGFGDIGNSPIDSYYNEFITRLLEHDKYSTQRNEILQEYVGDKKNLKDDLFFYDALVASTILSFYSDSVQTESILGLREEISTSRTVISGNIAKIAAFLKNKNIEHHEI